MGAASLPNWEESVKLSHRLFSGFAVALLLGALIPTVAANATTSGKCWRYKDTERSFAKKINSARSGSSVAKLRLDKQLSKAARRHSWEMKTKSSLYHTPSGTLGRRVTRWRVLGENVGVGSTVRSLHRAFMASPAHRQNVLYRSYRHVGVGVTRRNGRIWVTIIFESANDPGTRLSMPPC